MQSPVKVILVAATLTAAPAFADGVKTEESAAADEPGAVQLPPSGMARPSPTNQTGTVTQSALSHKIQFQGAYDDRLDKLDDKIDDLKDRAEGGAAVPAVTQAVANAEAKFAAAETRLKSFKDMQVDGWETHKAGLEQAFQEAEAAFTSAERTMAAH